MVVASPSVSPNNASDKILHCVRASNLHYSVQETPFSLYITVRKKPIKDGIEAFSENELLKTELQQMKQKYSELRNLLDKSEKEKNDYEKLKHEYNLKLEKATREIKEALAKSIDTSNKHDVLIEAHNKSKADLTRIKSENEKLKLEFKESSKSLKRKEKEAVILTSKLENLESSVKKLKEGFEKAENEKNKVNKEASKLRDQLIKLKERKPSESKSTTTITLQCSEASTSTIGMSSASAQFITSTKFCQTDSHPELPYHIDAPLPPIFGSSLVYKSKPIFFNLFRV